MSRIMLFSGLMATAWVAWLTPALALTTNAESAAVAVPLVAQSATDLGGTTNTGQPSSTEDLVIDDLTPEQVEAMEAIFNDYQPRIDAATQTYNEAAKEMLDLLRPETPDSVLVQARDEVLTAERAVEDLTFERNLALRTVLTVEQRQVINDYVRTGLGL